jgi:hypothetical protein
MSTVNYTNYKKDLTVRVFDSFYDYDTNVPAEEYDIVYSYFSSVMPRKAAGNFTVGLFRVAEDTNIPTLTLLQAMQGQSGLNLNASLAYYMNMIRSRATLLGINASSTPNQYAARLVIQ